MILSGFETNMEGLNLILDDVTFKTVIDSAPLVSIDILLKKGDQFLLGRRLNKPAQGYYFSPGGRIRKNEFISDAMIRIARDELNIELTSKPEFIGIFEHFYNDSIYENTSTHYVDIAYRYEVEKTPNLPIDQHSEYKWFTIDELLKSTRVHRYVKDCFRG